MKFSRLRQPAVSALAVLLISGAGIAFAGQAPAAPSALGGSVGVAAPAVVTSQAAPEVVEPAGADTDTLQEGDQTTPDAATTGSTGAAAPDAATEAAAPETGTEAATGESATESATEADGPGGHADDSNDPNADHQFEGVE